MKKIFLKIFAPQFVTWKTNFTSSVLTKLTLYNIIISFGVSCIIKYYTNLYFYGIETIILVILSLISSLLIFIAKNIKVIDDLEIEVQKLKNK